MSQQGWRHVGHTPFADVTVMAESDLTKQAPVSDIGDIPNYVGHASIYYLSLLEFSGRDTIAYAYFSYFEIIAI